MKFGQENKPLSNGNEILEDGRSLKHIKVELIR